jgi:DNA-binding transcriptional regulator YdaS (Cro superfamily)
MKHGHVICKLVTLGAMLGLITGTRAYAGGPRWIAGSSYFNSSAKGKPVVWANGQVSYYLDLGSLSATVTNAQARTMIASTVAVWNAVTTAAVKIAFEGFLSEDVNGTNVTAGPSGITMPADIQPTAVSKPVAVVFDADGSVINAFFGAGASSAASCQQNGVMTMVNNLNTSGNIAHALMLINGLCATNTAQIAVLQYQILRAFGQVLGLDWSQANEEMFLDHQVTSKGLAGWPILHPIELLCNQTGTACMPNATTLRLDDIAALNRVYPVTSANIASFTGKKLTAPNTISVQGTIQFRRGQGMQGVNAVLRPMIPGTDLPDIRYTVTAASGAWFQGNVGNLITGTSDAQGNPLNRFGTNNEAVEGFFDLSGVPLPAGQTAANYQLTFEAINPLYIAGDSVGSYTTGQVTPSGTMPTVSLPDLAAGSSIYQVVDVGNSADESLSGDDGVQSSPVNVPASGEWTARISGYGHTSWMQWMVRANREFTVEATALDESGQPTVNKAQLVLGVWNGTDAEGIPPVAGTSQPFNGSVAGLTTLPALTTSDGEVRLGIADLRGDGRPDYLYRGRVLYADTVAPPRLSATGGPIVIDGIGFHQNSLVSVNGVAATVTSVSPTQITAVAPASAGVTGNVLVQVQDPQTLGVSIIAGGLSYDAQNGDELAIVTAPANTIALGVPVPFTVKAMNWNNQFPAAGVTVNYAVTGGSAALGCGQTTCNLTTAGDGTATILVSATTNSLARVTASLTNGSNIATEFTGGTPPAISAITPNLFLAVGATAQWNPQGLVLNNGIPASGAIVTWTPSASSVSVPTTDSLSGSDGIITQQIAAGPLSAGDVIPVNACLVNATNCAQFTVVAVQTQTAQLIAESGTSQSIAATGGFAPVTLEVTDAFGHPMAGAVVTFYETLDEWTPPCRAHGVCPPAPLLEQQTVQATSATDGTVSLTPLSVAGQPSRLFVTAVTGESATLNFELDKHP